MGKLTPQQRKRQDEYRARWRARPNIRKRLAARTAQWRKQNPEKHKAYLERTRDQRRIQATKANWRRKGYPTPTRPMPKRCENCKRSAKISALHLDHCHKTGKFRGWLCVGCNTAMGHLGDTIAGLKRAIRYMERAYG